MSEILNLDTKESVITLVGFLGAGKTTLLKYLEHAISANGGSPYIILNDYENAQLDAQQFADQIKNDRIKSLSGSCVCCTGLHVLREFVNDIPERNEGVTLIEANGTTDAVSLAGFLGTGLKDRFLPPVQFSVVDVANWQKRGEHNELEANQIQLSSLIVLTHLENASADRIAEVKASVRSINSKAKLVRIEEIDISTLAAFRPVGNIVEKIDHLKTHWASCSVSLPVFPNRNCIDMLCSKIPRSILRVKACVQVRGEEGFTYFERTPDGKLTIRPLYGVPPMGATLLTVGLGSDADILKRSIKETLFETSLVDE